MPTKTDAPAIAIADIKGVKAVLGPTNTGKTHYAIERMVAHRSGLIGLPLRLLAREVYHRIAERVGSARVSLITGEEKITPPEAVFQVATVEAMPAETNAEFVAIDEVQLAGDLERGHTFTDRLLNLRGRSETLLLGAQTVEPVLRQLMPGIEITHRVRMSMLTYSGSKKITRLPPRSAVVAFSADEVYAIAELVRRRRGGAAVVLGSLSPRTRNAQVGLYQSGEVDFLIATDAIGMGLNLDLNHVAFAQDHKFDGLSYRRLTPAEMAQIAGRAGRHTNHGTFGVTGKVAPFEDGLVERLETHDFDPAKVLIWRNRQLDFSSTDALKQSLETASSHRLLMKSFAATDLVALETLCRDEAITARSGDEARVKLLWEVCQTPDYRKISPGDHAELLSQIFLQLTDKGHIDEDWIAAQVKRADQMRDDIALLSQKIAQIRSWTYLSNRAEWLENATYWQEKTRDIENRLSDALHQSLTKRFIDRRTSILMKRLRDNDHMEAEIKPDGAIEVEGHRIGVLKGFRFSADSSDNSLEAKAMNAAAAKVLAAEISKRAKRLAGAANNDFALDGEALLRWLGEPVARLGADENILKPKIILLADEQLSGPEREGVATRLERFVANHIGNLLKPLVEMGSDQTLEGMARGVAFQLVENLGNIDRRTIAEDLQALPQEMRGQLRRHGVRFGAHSVFIPALLKPAPAELLLILWGLKHDRLEAAGKAEILAALGSGRTSMLWDKAHDEMVYHLAGFRRLGSKAVRIDILERLADLIRPALAWRPPRGQSKENEKATKDAAIETSPAKPDEKPDEKPDGAIDGRRFYVTPAMMSILGATHEDMEMILKGLGYKGERRPLEEIRPASAQAKAETPGTDTAISDDDIQKHNGEDGSSKQMPEGKPAQMEKNAAPDQTNPTSSVEEKSEDATILIWRWGGAGARKGNAKNKNTARQKKGDGKSAKQAFDKRPGKPSFKNHGKKPAGKKQPDPDSPFAKLAALKGNLKSGG